MYLHPVAAMNATWFVFKLVLTLVLLNVNQTLICSRLDDFPEALKLPSLAIIRISSVLALVASFNMKYPPVVTATTLSASQPMKLLALRHSHRPPFSTS